LKKSQKQTLEEQVRSHGGKQGYLYFAMQIVAKDGHRSLNLSELEKNGIYDTNYIDEDQKIVNKLLNKYNNLERYSFAKSFATFVDTCNLETKKVPNANSVIRAASEIIQRLPKFTDATAKATSSPSDKATPTVNPQPQGEVEVPQSADVSQSAKKLDSQKFPLT